VANSQGPIGCFYRSLKARIGPAEANTATAHKLARIFYSLWSDPDPDLMKQHEQSNRQRTTDYLLSKKAHFFGLELVPQAAGVQ
jgi:transposase